MRENGLGSDLVILAYNDAGKGYDMASNDEFHALVPRMEQIVADLDNLQLSTVAVHVEFALRILEDIIVGGTSGNHESVQ